MAGLPSMSAGVILSVLDSMGLITVAWERKIHIVLEFNKTARPRLVPSSSSITFRRAAVLSPLCSTAPFSFRLHALSSRLGLSPGLLFPPDLALVLQATILLPCTLLRYHMAFILVERHIIPAGNNYPRVRLLCHIYQNSKFIFTSYCGENGTESASASRISTSGSGSVKGLLELLLRAAKPGTIFLFWPSFFSAEFLAFLTVHFCLELAKRL